ncbi:MAG: sialate O-acetylesterase [Puniceicoccales bacterium]
MINIFCKLRTAFTLTSLTAVCALHADVRMPALFSDHMVLQRSANAPVWGKADPGEKVVVSLDELSVETVTPENGQWALDLPLDGVSEGPHVLVIEGKNRIEIQDVVLGEVWLCSGQSNMAFTLQNSIGGVDEMKLPENRNLRHFLVTGPTAEFPKYDCNGHWVIAGPDTIKSFTAVGYFFGKKLSSELNKPVGLINTSVGGTPVEKWMSMEAISQSKALKESAEKYHNEYYHEFPKQQAEFIAKWNEWIETYHREDANPAAPEQFLEADSEGWQPVELLGELPESIVPDAGVIWLRRTVDIEDPDVSTWWTLNLGYPTGLYDVYWNGHRLLEETAKHAGDQDISRAYISTKKIKQGANELVLRLYQPQEGFAVSGDVRRFRLSFNQSWQSLEGIWEMKVESALPPLSEEAKSNFPTPPDEPKTASKNLPASWFNSKIHPLIPYAIKGAIWYQGESNSGRAYQYRDAFPMMIEDWRTRWNQGDFPFYFCQLASYGAKNDAPRESAWAELRNAQDQTLSLPNTGQAILTDLGESRDIHPRNKEEVGERLAMIALAQDYGFDLEYSGPRFRSMDIEGPTIRLQFDHIGGGLVAAPVPENHVVQSRKDLVEPLVRNSPESQLEGFAICGVDQQWQWANAHIDGTTVIVESPEVEAPIAVRYNWDSNPNGNLYNEAGLPAPPFRTDNFPWSTRNAKY